MKYTWLAATVIVTIFMLIRSESAMAQDGRMRFNHNSGRFEQPLLQRRRSARQKALYNQALESGKGKHFHLRSELGIGYVFASGKVAQSYHREDYQTGEPVFDTAFAGNISARSGVAFHLGFGFPLTTFSENAALLFSYGLSVHLLDWTRKELLIYHQKRDYGISTNTYSLNLGLDYKSGAEAMLDRSKRTCFTLGAGVAPTLQTGSWGVSGSREFSVYPFGKAEFGLATRFGAVKLRGNAYFGKYKYFNTPGRAENYNKWETTAIDITGKNQFSISLILQPMGAKWGDEDWYRDMQE